MTFAGWGGFNRRVDARESTHRMVARWSANTSTAGTTPNRIAGSAAPSMLQPTALDQPLIAALANSTPQLLFDGTNSDLILAPIPAIKLGGPCLYWAWHVRSRGSPASRTLWAEWGTTERFQVACDVNSITISIALSAVTLASVTFAVLQAVQLAGMFLEVLFDGNALLPANRLRLFVNSIEVSSSSSSGVLPQTLLLGNATNNWLGSLNGAGNLAMALAHFYIAQGIPNTAERAAIAADEAPEWTDPGSSGGAVTQWFQNLTLSGDVLSVPDLFSTAVLLSVSAARRPDGNADGSMAFANDQLFATPSAANNQLVTWGWAGWIAASDGTVTKTLLKYGSGLSIAAVPGDSHLFSQMADESLQFTVYTDAGGVNTRTASTAASVVSGAGVPAFVTLECNMAAAAEADKITITVNSVVQTLTFSGAGTMPSALNGSVTNMIVGNLRTNSTAQSFIGRYGRNLYWMGAKMPAASVGLLTAAARTGLKNFQPLT